MVKVFMTGSTGFVGNELLESLLKQPEITDFFLLVRDEAKARLLLFSTISKAISSQKNITFLVGDITLPSFGLGPDKINLLRSVDEVYHLASNITLSNDEIYRKVIFDVNFNGIKNLLALFSRPQKEQIIYYFSTAFLGGKTLAKVPEEFISKPNNFRNFYEESKWMSEEFIRESLDHDSNLKLVIIRPSIIIGGNETSFNKVKNQTLYYYSRILQKAYFINSEKEAIRIQGDSLNTLNIISVLDVVSFILSLRKMSVKNRFYNLVNPRPILSRDYLNLLKRIFHFSEGYLLFNSPNKETFSPAEKFILKKTTPYEPYNTDKTLLWDISNSSSIQSSDSVNLEYLNKHLSKFFSWIENAG